MSNELPKPDTHYHDDDTGRDEWCHSVAQVREYILALQAHLQQQALAHATSEGEWIELTAKLAAQLEQEIRERDDFAKALSELRINSGGAHFAIEGGAAGLLAQAFVASFDAAPTEAKNYIEVTFNSVTHGQIVVTAQRLLGKTPHQLRKVAEAERDAAIRALPAGSAG